MLTEQERTQICDSLNKMAWAALNKYEALTEQADPLDKRIDAAWGVYLSADEARDKVAAMPYVAVDEVFGEYVVDPTIVSKNQVETEAKSA